MLIGLAVSSYAIVSELAPSYTLPGEANDYHNQYNKRWNTDVEELLVYNVLGNS